ncbi:MAG TPA: type IV pili methyl-accepting chemotaxis transducer N-terminal domain-containing protein [Methylibium sp.]|nr:type IV pili methyl-accepting chemotaxis transducer N-terminal domain-containing protein [Methylibium sp.]
MISVLLYPGADPQAPDLCADLRAAGIHVLGAVACDKLVQEAVRQSPDLLVCWAQPADEALFRALELLHATQPAPVLAFAQDGGVETMERALDAGVQAWVVQGYAPARLRPLIQLAQARFRRERGLREALDELGHRFEERKLVDRAKGLLMLARQVPEDEAFRLLRSSAMQAKLRIGQFAQQLIDAAQEAAGVNRAGQLRMLSQRLVQLFALRAAGCDAEAALARQQRAVAQLDERIEQLGKLLSKATFGDLLDGVLGAWAALRAALDETPRVERLLPLDARAEALLQAADTLTAALEQAGAAPSLRIINLAGRQRMLSQRLAKEALFAVLLPEPAAGLARDAAAATAAEVDAALATLQAAPLAGPELRAALDEALADWPVLLAAAARAGSTEGRLRLAGASEQALERFERLTGQVERSLQRPIG